jgi:undecaprenyl diphosphate synthase
MDGNGRWAQSRGLQRVKGHEAGAKVVKEITTFCANHPEIKTLTLYAFSTENWKRPKLEVDYLMHLLQKYIVNERETYMKNGVRFEVIGNLSRFSPKLQKVIKETKELTKNNKALTQVLALNYGSRDEIVRAVKKILQSGDEVDEESISKALDTPYSDIDLLIRTSGEQRLSNFLLWQVSYAELFFTDTYWPDFNSFELREIIEDFKNRERKFGGI